MLAYLTEGNQIAKDVGRLSMQRYAWQDLSIMYEKQQDFLKALEAYKNYIILRDSIVNNEKEKKISRLAMQYEFDKQSDSIKLQEQITGEKLKQQQFPTQLHRQNRVENSSKIQRKHSQLGATSSLETMACI